MCTLVDRDIHDTRNEKCFLLFLEAYRDAFWEDENLIRFCFTHNVKKVIIQLVFDI